MPQYQKLAKTFLPFLDALIKNESRTFTISVYRNITTIGLFTQYNNFTPFSYKIGFIKCFIHRGLKISSSYVTFHNKINKIKNVLQKNMHPIYVRNNKTTIHYQKK